MRTVKILPSFEKSIRSLSAIDKNKIKNTLEEFNAFLISGIAAKGLGFKKLGRNIYEIRVDIRLRIIIKIEEKIIYFVLAGSHQNIKEYLKRYR